MLNRNVLPLLGYEGDLVVFEKKNAVIFMYECIINSVRVSVNYYFARVIILRYVWTLLFKVIKNTFIAKYYCIWDKAKCEMTIIVTVVNVGGKVY